MHLSAVDFSLLSFRYACALAHTFAALSSAGRAPLVDGFVHILVSIVLITSFPEVDLHDDFSRSAASSIPRSWERT